MELALKKYSYGKYNRLQYVAIISLNNFLFNENSFHINKMKLQ